MPICSFRMKKAQLADNECAFPIEILWIIIFYAAFDASRQAENVLVEIGRFHALFALRFKASWIKLSINRSNGMPVCFPQVKRQRAGYRVDFVHIYILRVVVDHKINTAHAVARKHAESFAGEKLNAFRQFFRQIGRNAFLRCLHAFRAFGASHVFIFVTEKFAGFDRFFERGCLIVVAVSENGAVDFFQIFYHVFHNDSCGVFFRPFRCFR